MNLAITVRSFERDWLDIFWEFTDATPTLEYEWRVLRSEGPAGPWDTASGWVREVYYFRDNISPLISRVRTLFYILEVRSRTSQEVITFGPACLQSPPDLVGMELIRQVRMELRFGSGKNVFILPRRTYGPRCLRCYDPDSGITIRSACRECFGTGFTGGYLSPIKTEADVYEKDTTVRRTEHTKLTEASTAARISNFPPVKAHDLLVTSENERYCVEKVAPGAHRGSPYEQDLFLRLVPRGDSEYDIPIDVGDLQLYSSDPSALTRATPTSDETISDEELLSMIGMFGGVSIK